MPKSSRKVKIKDDNGNFLRYRVKGKPIVCRHEWESPIYSPIANGLYTVKQYCAYCPAVREASFAPSSWKVRVAKDWESLHTQGLKYPILNDDGTKYEGWSDE